MSTCEQYNAPALGLELGADVLPDRSANAVLTPSQIDLVSQACIVAVDESARFLCADVRHSLAEALRVMGKPNEAEWVENGTPIDDKAG